MIKYFKHLFMYGIVGGLSTLVEWALFYILITPLDMGYLPATVISYIFSTLANWYFGRLIMFKASGSTAKEIWQIYLVSIVALLLNVLIMWIMVEKLLVGEFISKVTATVLVFAWNYLTRKLVIYKEK